MEKSESDPTISSAYNIQGTYEPEYQPVITAYEKWFVDGYDTKSQLCVYVDG